MKILVACETSGVVRRAFAARGHEVVSCDLLPAEDNSPDHRQCDVRDMLSEGETFDLMIAHPPCTNLSSSGLHWNTRRPERARLTLEALEFVRWLMTFPRIRHIAIENPVGKIGTAIRPADQYVQPWQYGHDASKRTGLWLKNLPLLVSDPAMYVAPRWVDGKPRWANQTDSGQNRLAPGADRWKERSRTYEGIATAMADQWGNLENEE